MLKKPLKINIFSHFDLGINKFKEYSIFFWIILISILGIIFIGVYKSNKSERSLKIKESLNNLYLKKTLKEITNNLNPRIKVISNFF